MTVSPPCVAPLSRAGLYVLLMGLLLPTIDFSIVNVALGAIAHSLHASAAELELIVAVYGVAFAVCLALGARLGDQFGRRRMFALGCMLFALSSLGCGVASSVLMLLVARTLQGVAAALLVPQILATIHVSLQGREHARAIGWYGSIGGLGFIVGQVLGGFLVSADLLGLSWRSVFLINLPVCALVLQGCRRWVPETRASHAASIDLPGTVLLALLLVCLLLAVALGPVSHWAWPCQAMLWALPVLVWSLWQVENRQQRRQLNPLLPPALLRLPSMRFGLWLAVVFFCCWGGFMFALALTLQAGAGLSPLDCGNAFIALGAAYFVGALLSTRVVARLGKERLLMLGCLIQMTGLLLLLLCLRQVWPHPDLLDLVPSTMLIGFGQSFIVSSFFRIGLSDVSREQAGAGSSMLSTVQQAALAMGPALLGAVFSSSLHRGDSYLQALQLTLLFELGLMLLLLVSAVVYRQRMARRVICVVGHCLPGMPCSCK
jgi:MFS family permease